MPSGLFRELDFGASGVSCASCRMLYLLVGRIGRSGVTSLCFPGLIFGSTLWKSIKVASLYIGYIEISYSLPLTLLCYMPLTTFPLMLLICRACLVLLSIHFKLIQLIEPLEGMISYPLIYLH